MILQQLTDNQSRILAIALFLATILFSLLFFIMPLWVNGQVYKSEIDELRFKLTKYEQAIISEPQLKTEQVGVLRELTEAHLFYHGVASGVAAAKVQTTIRTAVEKSKGNLISTQILAEKKGEYFTKILISLRLNGSDSVIQALLYELETSRPLLKVEKVVISSNRRPNKKKVIPLNVTLEISSYLAREEDG